jgi:alpha-galactosidase
MDVDRSWNSFSAITRETFSRNWQNGRLWWNDPDCLVLTGKLADNLYRFHATAILASGGMLLSGDDLPKLPPDRLAMLRKLIPPTGVAARFADTGFSVGAIDLPDKSLYCVFNWTDEPADFDIALPKPCHLRELWSGDDLGNHEGAYTVKALPAHDARVLVCTPE